MHRDVTATGGCAGSSYERMMSLRQMTFTVLRRPPHPKLARSSSLSCCNLAIFTWRAAVIRQGFKSAST